MKYFGLRTALSSLVLLLALMPVASSLQAQDGGNLDTEEQKTLYALGLAMAQNLGVFNLTTEELALVQQGLSDSVLKKDPKVDLQEYGPKIQGFAQGRAQQVAEKEKAAGADFLAKMAAEEGAVKKESGLIVREMTAGTGANPKATDTVTVHYHGTLRDGTVFDSSVDRGEPTTFGLNQVIPCWTEGVQQIKVGGKSKLTCPSDIAYGDQGRPPVIPGGAVLVFEVELISIGSPEPPAAPATPAAPAASEDS